MSVDVSAYLYTYVMYVLMAVVALFTCDQVVERNPRNAGALWLIIVNLQTSGLSSTLTSWELKVPKGFARHWKIVSESVLTYVFMPIIIQYSWATLLLSLIYFIQAVFVIVQLKWDMIFSQYSPFHSATSSSQLQFHSQFAVWNWISVWAFLPVL